MFSFVLGFESHFGVTTEILITKIECLWTFAKRKIIVFHEVTAFAKALMSARIFLVQLLVGWLHSFPTCR
jgi:hypothetical protein